MLAQSQYLRISVNNTCNLSCFFCHNEGAPITGESLSIDALEFACRIAKKKGFTKFKLTGGEPTIRRDICQLVERLAAVGLEDFSMITNGALLESLAEPLKKAGLQRINVSLHTLDPEKFDAMQIKNKVSMNRILRGIDKAIEVGFRDMKINFVYTGSASDADLIDLLEYIAVRNLTLVVLPVIAGSADDSQANITLDELYAKFVNMGIRSERTILDNEGIQKRLIVLDSGATILLRKDELSSRKPYTFCESCTVKKQCREGIFPLRLSAAGELIPCLASIKNRISIREALENQDEAAVVEAFHNVQGWRAAVAQA
ncbi:radical SAM protein [Ectobacillus ponti]|uniref:Radical SAM protein n=1 Tax=Ectobacillus ponti TaxID=2961894 RepID=A0AA41X8P0_9BACI|nr:radical SAM protein [Ectobacillus ponti]MCP8970941.1 radical SAM protein [Ectobacillus ponti]